MKRFFAGMENELFMIDETAQGYITTSRLTGTQPTRLAIDPQNKDRMYCATYGNGLWKSEDGGDNWTAIGKTNQYHAPQSGYGIRSAYVTFVAVHPTKQAGGNSIVYAGTEPSALYYSTDNGATWEEFKGIQTLPSKRNWQFPPRPYTSHVRWITPSYADENILHVSIEFGAYIRSTDHGDNWQDRPFNSPLDIHTLLAHPKAPGYLFAACGDGLSVAGHGYAESYDEGRSWTYLGEGLEKHPYLYNMVSHPVDSNDRLVSASRTAAQAHHSDLYSTVYRKKNNQPWREIAEGLPREGTYSHTLAADPDQPGVFYAMNNHGLYRLPAGETLWQQLDVAWKEKFRDQHPTCFMITDKSF